MKFNPADWSQDTAPLSLAGRGAWITIICAMWRSEERGKLSMPTVGFCRLLGASEVETMIVIDELVKMGICDTVTEANKNITLVCRRMLREYKHHKNNALRQERYRVTHNSNTSITGEKSEVRSQKSEVREEKKEEEAPSPVPVQNRFSEAIQKLRIGHIAFKTVPAVSLENTLKSWPESRWQEAIDSLIRRYAGANIPRPIPTLENHLAGKGGQNQPVKKYDSKKSFEQARDEILEKLNEADKSGGDSVSRCLSACNDLYYDIPKRDKETVVDNAYEIFKCRKKGGNK
jgi:hypothetical protein